MKLLEPNLTRIFVFQKWITRNWLDHNLNRTENWLSIRSYPQLTQYDEGSPKPNWVSPDQESKSYCKYTQFDLGKFSTVIFW
jgi:hypothetical protein